MLLGWASSDLEGPENASDRIRNGLALWQATESKLGLSYFFCLLGEANDVHGNSGEALESIKEAAEFATQTGERWWEAELYRLKGELLLNAECGM